MGFILDYESKDHSQIHLPAITALFFKQLIDGFIDSLL